MSGTLKRSVISSEVKRSREIFCAYAGKIPHHEL